jgi:hypothetical protein
MLLQRLCSKKLVSLFPGLGYAAGYKISQRIYKFGGQPWFNDLIKKNYKDNFTNTFGERNGKLMMQATAGRFVLIHSHDKLCSFVDAMYQPDRNWRSRTCVPRV